MDDAVVRLPLGLLADSGLNELPEAGLVVGMNPLKEFFESGQTILWIKAQNTVTFLRPVPDIRVWTPCPTACLAESLRLRQGTPRGAATRESTALARSHPWRCQEAL